MAKKKTTVDRQQQCSAAITVNDAAFIAAMEGAEVKAQENERSKQRGFIDRLTKMNADPMHHDLVFAIGAFEKRLKDYPKNPVAVAALEGFMLGMECADRTKDYPKTEEAWKYKSEAEDVRSKSDAERAWSAGQLLELRAELQKYGRRQQASDTEMKVLAAKMHRHSAPDGTLVQEEELLKRFDNKPHEWTKDKRWKAVSHEVLKEVRESKPIGTSPSWLSLTIRTNIAEMVKDGITEEKARHWAGRFSDITRRYARKIAARTGKTP